MALPTIWSFVAGDNFIANTVEGGLRAFRAVLNSTIGSYGRAEGQNIKTDSASVGADSVQPGSTAQVYRTDHSTTGGQNFLPFMATPITAASPWGQLVFGVAGANAVPTDYARGSSITVTVSADGSFLIFASFNVTNSFSTDVAQPTGTGAGLWTYSQHYLNLIPELLVRVDGGPTQVVSTTGTGQHGAGMCFGVAGVTAIDSNQAAGMTCMGVYAGVARGSTYEFALRIEQELSVTPNMTPTVPNAGNIKKMQLIGSGSDISVIFIKSGNE